MCFHFSTGYGLLSGLLWVSEMVSLVRDTERSNMTSLDGSSFSPFGTIGELSPGRFRSGLRMYVSVFYCLVPS